MKSAIVIVGKAPNPGTTKTRLCPPLTADEAAGLYRAFLLDTVATARSVGWDRVIVVYPPSTGARASLRELLPDDVRLQPQRGRGLGTALSEAFERQHAAGFDRVVLISSDNPTVPGSLIEEAGEVLSRADAVLGPTTDGGYYLIGMNQPHPELFERITWSTSLVFGETVERARDAGIRIVSVAEWYDIDTIDDVHRLKRELDASDGTTAPETSHMLAVLADRLETTDDSLVSPIESDG